MRSANKLMLGIGIVIIVAGFGWWVWQSGVAQGQGPNQAVIRSLREHGMLVSDHIERSEVQLQLASDAEKEKDFIELSVENFGRGELVLNVPRNASIVRIVKHSDLSDGPAMDYGVGISIGTARFSRSVDKDLQCPFRVALTLDDFRDRVKKALNGSVLPADVPPGIVDATMERLLKETDRALTDKVLGTSADALAKEANGPELVEGAVLIMIRNEVIEPDETVKVLRFPGSDEVIYAMQRAHTGWEEKEFALMSFHRDGSIGWTGVWDVRNDPGWTDDGFGLVGKIIGVPAKKE